VIRSIPLRAQLFGGFGLIGLIVVALVGVGLYSAISSQSNFRQYEASARTSVDLASVQDGVATLRNAAFAFRVTPTPDNLEGVRTAQSGSTLL
jgi:CHASE3 domain sensor protein